MKLFKKEKFAIQYNKSTPEEYEKVWKGRVFKSLSHLLKASTFWLFVLCFFYIFKNL